MRITIDVSDEVADFYWKEHEERIAKIKDQWERTKESIWSREEIVAADAIVLLRFFAEGKLILGTKRDPVSCSDSLSAG